MAFILKRNESVGKGLVRVARKTLVRAIDGVTDARAADGVHAARKSTKKVRAILALVGRSVRHTHSLEKRLRRIGRSLSPLRDARAVAETLRRVAPRAPAGAWASVRVAADVLTRSADRHERAAAEHDVLGDTRHALKRASRELRRTRIDRVDRGDVKAGVKRAYRRARRSLAAAVDSGANDDVHRWRKRVKTLWYHLRLLGNHWHVADEVDALGRLEELLGEDHNVTVLEDRMRNTIRALGTTQRRAVRRICRAYQRNVRREAFALGRRFFADAPKAFVERLDTTDRRSAARPQKAA